MAKRFSETEMGRLYNLGLTDRTIAFRMGCSTQLVKAFRHDRGLPANPGERKRIEPTRKPVRQGDHLAECALAADAAGMSYGYYMAANRMTPEQFEEFERRRKIDMGWKPCDCCRVLYKPSRSDQRFCSDSCRNKYNNRIAMQKRGKVVKGDRKAVVTKSA